MHFLTETPKLNRVHMPEKLSLLTLLKQVDLSLSPHVPDISIW